MKFAERYGPWAVVAGASEGVGASVARQLGARGVNVVLSARQEAALEEVAESVSTDTIIFPFDLSRADATIELARATSDIEVGSLIYNAGAETLLAPFLERPLEDSLQMLSRNCTNVVGTTHHFGQSMLSRGHGGIVLVTSGAAWAGSPHMAVYSASKAFDLMLAESLWAELRPHGIDVLAAVLGRTDTPAFRRLLDGRESGELAQPDDVARDILDNLPEGPTFPAGPSLLGSLPRRQAVEAMALGSASLLD